MEILLIVFIAFFIALLFSMLGLGGAIIYTPLFFWTGIPLFTAIPMALLLNAITTASASMTYLKQQIVDTGIAFPIIFTSILGALLGSYLVRLIEPEIIILLLSIIILFAGIRILFYNSIGLSVGLEGRKKIMVGASMGFFIGIISSLVGIGGGTFMVPLLLILGFETKNATATSSFIITFMSLSGFLGHLTLGIGKPDLSILLYAGTAAFVGAQTGSRVIFKRISARTINRMFAVVLLLVASKLLYGLM